VLWAALATVYVVWGSTYLAIRVMVETMPPLLSAGTRFAVAGAIFWLFLRIRRGADAVRITPRQAAWAAVLGTLLCFGGNGLVTVAEQEVPSGLTALIIGVVPLFVVLFRLSDGDRPQRSTLIGVVLGFIGLAILVLPGDRPGDAPLWGVLLVIAAAFLWATGSYYSKRMELPPDTSTSTTYQMLFGGGGMLVVGAIAGETGEVDFAAFSTDSVLALLYLIFIGGLLAYTAYNWLLAHAPISTAATYAYVNPVIAVFLGWLILEEEITATVVAGAAAIVVSVYTVVRRESGGRREAPARPAHEPEAEPARP
jgi:drug/metabolite transporter (DMT)-like permease